ncbi:DUF1176 domain-containing protein [Hoeflea olei]|uniref:Secreted protein n=1 Tax=Hoeflea olei TaxID=1480615 RepID=A0A1C1YVN9_9HYPH|nr:DUF1176 domain-containing protein [Hoeflea olei]OCW57517.1 hypothetical protein AWJ14_13260 [Hoeflea olei]
MGKQLIAAVTGAVTLAMATTAAPAQEPANAELDAARAFVLSALPGQCDADPAFGDSMAYPVSWRPGWAEADTPDSHGTLYKVFCFAGAYNLIDAYVFKGDDETFSLIGFAEPVYTVEYAEGDETQTELKAPPAVTGFSATLTLVNSEFDPKTNTISSLSSWRGLGDAWAAGSWVFREGQFVLSRYAIDPIYEANLDNATDAQRDTAFEIYP